MIMRSRRRSEPRTGVGSGSFIPICRATRHPSSRAAVAELVGAAIDGSERAAASLARRGQS